MKNTELERFLTHGKMKFEKSEGGKHTRFEYHTHDGNTILPRIFNTTLSRDQGETTNLVFGSVARELGLSESELKTAIGCNLSRECILVCALIRITAFWFNHRVRNEPLVYDDNIQQEFANSIELLLAEVRNSKKPTWSKPEKKALERAQYRLAVINANQHAIIRSLAVSIKQLINA